MGKDNKKLQEVLCGVGGGDNLRDSRHGAYTDRPQQDIRPYRHTAKRIDRRHRHVSSGGDRHDVDNNVCGKSRAVVIAGVDNGDDDAESVAGTAQRHIKEDQQSADVVLQQDQHGRRAVESYQRRGHRRSVAQSKHKHVGVGSDAFLGLFDNDVCHKLDFGVDRDRRDGDRILAYVVDNIPFAKIFYPSAKTSRRAQRTY